jgi:hypothetical protein
LANNNNEREVNIPETMPTERAAMRRFLMDNILILLRLRRVELITSSERGL